MNAVGDAIGDHKKPNKKHSCETYPDQVLKSTTTVGWGLSRAYQVFKVVEIESLHNAEAGLSGLVVLVPVVGDQRSDLHRIDDLLGLDRQYSVDGKQDDEEMQSDSHVVSHIRHIDDVRVDGRQVSIGSALGCLRLVVTRGAGTGGAVSESASGRAGRASVEVYVLGAGGAGVVAGHVILAGAYRF